MAHLPALVTDLALILIVAGITTLLMKKLRQPVIIGYILAGFLLGPVVKFVPNLGDPENINTLAEIGVIFMMFALGLEFSLHKMASVGVTAVVSALIQVAGMALIGYLISLLLGWGSLTGLFLGAMLGMSSTIITLKAIEDTGQKQERFSELAVGTLVVEDVTAIFLMLILSTLVLTRGGAGFLLANMIRLLVYLALWLILGIFFVPTLMRKLQPLFNDETLLIVSLAVCFGMVWLANAIGFSSALGAFMAGSILASTMISGPIEKMVTPLKDLFVAVFFVSVGMIVEPAAIWDHRYAVLLLAAAAILFKTLLLTASMSLTGQSLADALRAALAQTQVGEFSFIIASLDTSTHMTRDFLYPVIVAVAVLTAFTTPFLIKGAAPVEKLLRLLLPDCWLESLDRRACDTPRQELGEEHVSWPAFLKRYFATFALYALIIGGLIFLAVQLLLPWARAQLANLADVAVCATLLLCIAPFLPPLLVFRRTAFTSLWLQSRNNRFPLLLLMGLRAAAAAAALALPPLLIFDLPLFWLAIIALPVAVAASQSSWLRGRYLQIAAKFLANLNEKRLMGSCAEQRQSMIDENVWVRQFICPEHSAGAGKTLSVMNWGRRFHVNVIKILRGRHHIAIPQGCEILHKQDRLYLSGSREALQSFSLYTRQQQLLEAGDEDDLTLREFVAAEDCLDPDEQVLVFATRVGRGDAFAGRSIREADIRNRWNCFVVGVTRENYPLTDPHPSMVLQEGDTLWVLGTQKMAAILLKADLL